MQTQGVSKCTYQEYAGVKIVGTSVRLKAFFANRKSEVAAVVQFRQVQMVCRFREGCFVGHYYIGILEMV